MNSVTLVILGKKIKINRNVPFDILYFNGKDLKSLIDTVNTKYVFFIKDTDSLSKYYFESVINKVNEDFDCCFINYKCLYEDISSVKVATDFNELKKTLPLYGSYIWSFIFNVEKLKVILNSTDFNKINELVKTTFIKTNCINRPIYFHNPYSESIINSKNFCYCDHKDIQYYKNIIYVGMGCSGTFNGYISWVRNIGKCFGSKYKITLLYDDMTTKMLEEYSLYFNCVKFNNFFNYMGDRILVTYSNYFYPRNIIVKGNIYLFIHGNASDYKNACHFFDDIYSEYYAVSKVASKKAIGYYPRDDVKTLYNPFILDEKLVKPHLRLVSAMRSSYIKRPERIKMLADILDELDIPYTWNVFTDKNENTNINGLIYRRRLSNPLPYINDSDYFVLLSDSEALPYSVVEALSLHTKVIVTPLETYDELGVVDGENAVVIPFEYFEEKNKAKLIEIVKRIYKDKDKTFDYEFDSSLYQGYNDIFI